MGNWGDALEGFGLETVDTLQDAMEAVGAVVGGIGGEFTNTTTANTNLVEVSRLRALSDIQRKQANTEIIQNVVYCILALGAVTVITMLVLRILKK